MLWIHGVHGGVLPSLTSPAVRACARSRGQWRVLPSATGCRLVRPTGRRPRSAHPATSVRVPAFRPRPSSCDQDERRASRPAPTVSVLARLRVGPGRLPVKRAKRPHNQQNPRNCRSFAAPGTETTSGSAASPAACRAPTKEASSRCGSGRGRSESLATARRLGARSRCPPGSSMAASSGPLSAKTWLQVARQNAPGACPIVADRSAQAALGIWPALNARLADDQPATARTG